MPTKKQRRRALKERRHEYETVWVDEEGNELEEPPEDLVSPAPAKRDGARPRAKEKANTQPQRGGRPVRVPQPPSWRRAARRSLMIGAVIFVAFYLLGGKNGGNRFASAIEITLIYTLLFIPFTFTIDRFAYNRWQRREAQQGTRRQPPKKR
jgi:hypothetical protein